jgi:predicted acylesterase/phospholipase RssA
MAEVPALQPRALEPLPDPRPLRTPPPPEGTFEIALCLAGAVSAGAYTAGVLDFLVEALETRYQAEADNLPDTPPHNAVIRVITGASAGAITAAIAGSALAYGSIRLGAWGRSLMQLGWSFFLRNKLTATAMGKIGAALLERKLLSKRWKPAPRPVDRPGRT